jgi:hypothetical protein
MKRFFVLYCAALTLTACGSDGDSTPPPDDVVDPDPLDLQSTAEVGSLDELHERIISQRCSGQPGLCHNGQFEPNLSTPALMFSYLVNRPGIEANRLRVKPGDSAASLFIDKIRNRNGVLSQMPLGAEPLEEVDIAAIEKWIDDGALRTPGGEPAPSLNNPPRRPEIAIFNTGGTRLDGTGPITITPGGTLVIRHTVQDFETADSAIPFRALIFSLGDGTDIVVNPAAPQDKHIAVTTFDSNGPQGKGDQLNYVFTWNVPAGPTMQVRNSTTGVLTQANVSGATVTPLVLYVDGATPGIIALDFSTTTIGIQ